MIQTFNVIVVIWINIDVFKKKELRALCKNCVFTIPFPQKTFGGRGATKNKIFD
jgi:hypothetical protein